MCGLVAILSARNKIAPEALSHSVQSMLHRGPDHHSSWISSNENIGLGHARLSINDIASGNQPIANETNEIRIVAVGEFYDFESIRKNLQKNGHEFRTRSDSEIALHLYEEQEADCLNSLDGEFAFVIWDEVEEILFAARDRFGIKPLFYAHFNETLYIASEIKALLAAGVPAKWDHQSVFQNLFLCLDQERTLFEGIRQIPPGHFIKADRNSITVNKYWDVNYPRISTSTRQPVESEVIENLTYLLDNAVKVRMRADVSVGCYLSGGLDSSSILGIATRHATKPITAFTIGFGTPGYDESIHARHVAEDAGVAFELVSMESIDYEDHFVDAVGQGEGVQYNMHGVARYLLSRSVNKKGYKSVLAGEGADECFAGYGFCHGALANSGSAMSLPSWIRLGYQLLKPPNLYQRKIRKVSKWLDRASRLNSFPPDLLKTAALQISLIRSLMAQSFLDVHGKDDPYRHLISNIDPKLNLAGREPVKKILYLWLKTIFANYLLGAERLDMAHAVEVRLPFLDRNVFEYTSQLPASILFRESKVKYPLLQVAKPYIPTNIYNRTKQPFFGPPSTTVAKNPLNELTQDILHSSTVSDLPFFDQKSVLKYLGNASQNSTITPAALDPIIFMVTSLGILQERYGL